MPLDPEVVRLESVAQVYDPSDPNEEFDYYAKRLQVEVIKPWMIGRRVLEMGCATGELTSLMAPLSKDYHVVEGSSRNVEAARQRVPGATYFTSLWESFEPSERYSDILLVCALEHVEDPVAVTRRAREWLAEDGRLHIIVPNADSLHRLVGVEMNMLPQRTSLSESDLRVGHRRVYVLDTLLADLRESGFSSLHWQGVFLKFLSNQQMLDWDWSLIHALHRVGQRFPDRCAEIYVAAVPA